MSKQKIIRRIIWEICLVSLTPISGAIISVLWSDWTWFARSGALMVAISIATFGLSFAKAAQAELLNAMRDILINKGEGFKELITPDHVWHHTKESYFQYGLGFISGFIGTLIWGFGDLIGRL